MSDLAPEDLKPGRELDQRVVEALGWRDFVKSRFNGELLGLNMGAERPRSGNISRHSPVPHYSTDIAVAMIFVNVWPGDVDQQRQNGQWRVTLFQPSVEWEAWGETLAHAICLTVLKAKVRGR